MKKIAPITSINIVNLEKQFQNSSFDFQNGGEGKEMIEIEKEQKLFKSTMRYQAYRDILYNEDSSKYSTCTAFYGFNGILFGLFIAMLQNIGAPFQ